ncbi:MAG: helix-turn-helix transcriptional regulator [Spirochaetia bacterium]
MDDRLLVLKMIAYIEKNLRGQINAETMAVKSGYSANRLRQKFYTVTGDTPSGYIRKRRLSESAKEILDGARIIDVALKYGYSSQDNFTTAFRSYFGIPPKELYTVQGKYRRFVRKMREVYSIMEIEKLKQPSLCTTLMGCVKGASDYFDYDYSAPMLFGLTGHGFIINIHKELCPSGPYVWNKDEFFRLLTGLGITAVEKLRYVKGEDSPAKLETLESSLKNHLDAGELCMLDFLEHQLLNGYDEKGLLLLQPWNGQASTEIPRITYGSWAECLTKEGWVHFTVLKKSRPGKNMVQGAAEALKFALDMYRNPEKYQSPDYRIGYGAYESWIDGVRRGLGTSHGHWWNGHVWTECRENAAAFFSEFKDYLEDGGKGAALCDELTGIYRNAARELGQAKEKDVPPDKQEEHLTFALDQEKKAENRIEELVSLIG